MNNKERLNELYKKYNLSSDDYFKHKFYTIITRSGIDKIQSKAGIVIHYELTYHSPDTFTAIIKANATMDKQSLETYGEVNPKNNTNAYPIAMAEKRAMSRAVLKLAGFYEAGAFGVDESEDFKKSQYKSIEREQLDERHIKYDGFCTMLKSGQITLNDLHKEYDIPATVEYKLSEIAKG